MSPLASDMAASCPILKKAIGCRTLSSDSLRNAQAGFTGYACYCTFASLLPAGTIPAFFPVASNCLR